jgi:hypothetical protein
MQRKPSIQLCPVIKNVEHNHNLLTANESFQNVAEFKYLETKAMNPNQIHEKKKTESRLNSGNACCYSGPNLLSSQLLWKNLKD